MKIGLLSAAILTLAACGDAEEVAEGAIDTGDVKGDIDLMDCEGGELNYNYNGQACKAYKVEIGETAELIIFPDDKSFEEQKEIFDHEAKSSFSDMELISSTDDCIFFKKTRKPFGEDESDEKTGYGFIRVVKKNDKTNYLLKSSGENPLEPIWSKADAEKLMKVAKSFKPKS